MKFDKVIFCSFLKIFWSFTKKINKETQKGTKYPTRYLYIHFLSYFNFLVHVLFRFWDLYDPLLIFLAMDQNQNIQKNRTKYPRWVKYIRVEYFSFLVITEKEILWDNGYYIVYYCWIFRLYIWDILLFYWFFLHFGKETKSPEIVQ